MKGLNWTHRNNQRIGVAVADSLTGPIIKQMRPTFTAPGATFPSEDPFIWFDKSAHRYCAIVKDQNGHFTPQRGRSLILWESPDGFDWKLAAHPMVTTTDIRWADGRKQAVVYLERPQLFFENGRPAVLLCAVAEEAKLAHSYNLQIPLRPVP